MGIVRAGVDQLIRGCFSGGFAAVVVLCWRVMFVVS